MHRITTLASGATVPAERRGTRTATVDDDALAQRVIMVKARTAGRGQ